MTGFRDRSSVPWKNHGNFASAQLSLLFLRQLYNVIAIQQDFAISNFLSVPSSNPITERGISHALSTSRLRLRCQELQPRRSSIIDTVHCFGLHRHGYRNTYVTLLPLKYVTSSHIPCPPPYQSESFRSSARSVRRPINRLKAQ